jgi:hypothetical protein
MTEEELDEWEVHCHNTRGIYRRTFEEQSSDELIRDLAVAERLIAFQTRAGGDARPCDRRRRDAIRDEMRRRLGR